MSPPLLRISVGLVAWGGCLIGSLSIANWPGDLGHSICGPWGCGPPLQALIACHTAWFVALAPAAGLLVWSRKASAETLRRIGVNLVLLAVAVLTMLIVYQLLVWRPQASEWQRPYFWQRFGFSIATTVDVPVVQVLLIGLAMRLSGHARLKPATQQLDNMLSSGIERTGLQGGAASESR